MTDSDDKPVVVVDYGLGNLFSIVSAFRVLGTTAVLTASPDDVRAAAAVVLPGVGAFGSAMNTLRSTGLADALLEVIDRGTPVLAVCLGMQLLLDRSYEFGEHKGLGVVGGTVQPLRPPGGNRIPKVPHIGWQTIRPPVGRTWSGTLLSDTPPESHLYFVHSYRCVLDDERLVLAESDFDDRPFTSSFSYGSIDACQFHPERSGPVGLNIYGAFLRRVGTTPDLEVRR